MPVERAWISPPRSRMGAITPEERAAVRSRSPVGGTYDTAIDRESAQEMLEKRAAQKAAGDAAAVPATPRKGTGAATAPAAAPKAEPPARSRMDEILWGTNRRQGAVEAAAKSATRSMATGLGRQILRGVLGSIFGGKRR
jgi:DNA helicase HerA-like ATPase